MSGLAPLLAGREPRGVHLWRSPISYEDLADLVAVVDWRLAVVDGIAATTKPAFLDSVGQALGFPDTYGRNLDALADCLDDLTVPTLLLWDEWGLLAHDDARTATALLAILTARATDADRAPFTVLVRGDGPEALTPALLD